MIDLNSSFLSFLLFLIPEFLSPIILSKNPIPSPLYATNNIALYLKNVNLSKKHQLTDILLKSNND